MYTRIVVPLDGSDVAEGALRHAVEFARKLNVPLHLIRVVDLHALSGLGASGAGFDYASVATMIDDEVAAAHDYLAVQIASIESEGVPASSAVLSGPVARSIVEQAETGDLLVLATHGRTGMARWFIGSVAEEVVRRAPVPVLLVRRQDEAGNGDA